MPGRLVIIAGGLAMTLGVAVLLVMLNLLPNPLAPEAASSEAAENGAPEEEGHPLGIMYSTGERVVNLADPGGYRYLKVEVVLEFEPAEGGASLSGEAYRQRQQELAEEMEGRAPALGDALIMVLSSKRVSELSSAEGKERLREELKQRLSQVVAGAHRIQAVYFAQFVIQ